MCPSDRSVAGLFPARDDSLPPASGDAPDPVRSVSHASQSSDRDSWLSIVPAGGSLRPANHRATFRPVGHNR